MSHNQNYYLLQEKRGSLILYLYLAKIGKWLRIRENAGHEKKRKGDAWGAFTYGGYSFTTVEARATLHVESARIIEKGKKGCDGGEKRS